MQQSFVHGQLGIDGIKIRNYTLFIIAVAVVVLIVGGSYGRDASHHFVNIGLPAAYQGKTPKTRWNAASDQEAIRNQ